MNIQPYLFFDGRAEEALKFYGKVLGAKVEMMMRFKDAPDQSMVKPESAEKVMHACFKVGDTSIMASDGHCQNKSAFQGFALTINAANEAEANRVFGALGDGGQVQMPLAKTFFSPCFGTLADRFGVTWMVIVLPQQ